MSEASLWKPEFVQGLIDKLPKQHEIVGAVLTSFKPKGVSKMEHLKRYFVILGPRVFTSMALRELYDSLTDKLDLLVTLPTPHSIWGVCRRNKIPTTFTKDVNSQKTMDWIKKFEPDILLSSGNQIFSKELLEVPKVASLNRHTSLLPAYAGIYPIFWCMLNNEKKVGVSVHTMTEKVDEGLVIAQKSIFIKPEDTFFSLFEKGFKLSVDVVLEAIEKSAKGDFTPIDSGLEKSYYSYPTYQDVQRFRKMGRKII